MNFSEANLKELLERYGEVESVVIIREKQEPYESKKFGFVCFKNDEDAQRCVQASVAENLKAENRIVFIGYAQRKEDREKHLTAVFLQKPPALPAANKPIPAEKFESSAALPTDLFPNLRNFRVELVNRISEQCSQADALALLDKLKKISVDQIKAIVMNNETWEQWKEKVLSD